MTILSRILELLSCEPSAPQPVNIEPILDGLATAHGTEPGTGLDWRNSVVDLMKTLDMDSGPEARVELATELGYRGDTAVNTDTMNRWLHREIMRRVRDNGGTVPEELL